MYNQSYLEGSEHMIFIELSATILGLLCVWLTVKQNIWCWPSGIAMVVLYIFIFYHARLYSDMGLQVIYVFLQIYGWYNWLHGGKERGKLSVSRISFPHLVLWFFAALISTFLLGTLMSRCTNAALPFWDALTTVLSLIAQWFMAIKILESWLVWLIVDIVSICIYGVKGLYFTMALYGVFLFLASKGFFTWKRSIQSPQPACF